MFTTNQPFIPYALFGTSRMVCSVGRTLAFLMEGGVLWLREEIHERPFSRCMVIEFETRKATSQKIRVGATKKAKRGAGPCVGHERMGYSLHGVGRRYMIKSSTTKHIHTSNPHFPPSAHARRERQLSYSKCIRRFERRLTSVHLMKLSKTGRPPLDFRPFVNCFESLLNK